LGAVAIVAFELEVVHLVGDRTANEEVGTGGYFAVNGSSAWDRKVNLKETGDISFVR
jgi:hypothetical protein